MKTHVLTLSQVFPTTHPRKGERTNFSAKLINAVRKEHNLPIEFCNFGFKLHTIRTNYELWRNRFEQIERGEACLSIRQWSGIPYKSKQIEICKLTKNDGIGLQCLHIQTSAAMPELWNYIIDDLQQDVYTMAVNDGLSFTDWSNWFKDCDFSKPLAIIHFTSFRY